MTLEAARENESHLYRDRAETWRESLPAHWGVRRLRSVVEMRVSNVDKHTNDGEIPVQLCNYVDVYYNDRIDGKLSYMKATASPAEADRFRLKPNDVVITKDSEAWNDIAVPALVVDPPYDLVCGYHLAILRPSDAIDGAYLARVMQAPTIAHQLHVGAQGITRYGLTHNDILSTSVPLPPPDEQATIVRYLDHADDLISRYISAKEHLIALLEEQRQAAIHQAVTRGLDPTVATTSSEVPELGNIPSHWRITQLGRLGTFSKGSGGTKDDEVDCGLPCVRYGDIYTSHKYFVQRTRSLVARHRAPDYAQMRYGDVLFTGSGETIEDIGKSVVNLIHDEAYCGADVILFRPDVENEPEFMGYLLDSPRAAHQKSCMGRGITIMHVYASQLKYLWLALPLPAEQAQIARYLKKATTEVSNAIDRAQRQIGLMDEYRTRLIADAVTGQLDVRDAVVELPA